MGLSRPPAPTNLPRWTQEENLPELHREGGDGFLKVPGGEDGEIQV